MKPWMSDAHCATAVGETSAVRPTLHYICSAVIPEKAGIQNPHSITDYTVWTPVFAGVTKVKRVPTHYTNDLPLRSDSAPYALTLHVS